MFRTTLTVGLIVLLMRGTNLCAQDCPADFDGSGEVGIWDVMEVLSNWGECPECEQDLNGDGWVDVVDYAYVWEIFETGSCPEPGIEERFDRLVIVNATDDTARSLGLIVTRIYATGDGVAPGDPLLLVDDLDLLATGVTVIHQVPRDEMIGHLPPDTDEIAADPNVVYDSFVTIGALQDEWPQSFAWMTGSAAGGSWFHEPYCCRDAVDLQPITGSDEYGVLIAQITLEGSCPPEPQFGYSGTARLYLSPLSGGSLQGVDVPFVYGGVDACAADLDGSGTVGLDDFILATQDAGACPGCPADFNGDDIVNDVDFAMIFEQFGMECPAPAPGFDERFDEIVAVDVTDPSDPTMVGLVVTHLYATGDAVGPDDSLLFVRDVDIAATGDTRFFNDFVVGGDGPPECMDVMIDPVLAHDSFVTFRELCDYLPSEGQQGIDVGDTTIQGGWFETAGVRDAEDIGALTGNSGQHGVRIAQISIELGSEYPTTGYTGSARLYTSVLDCGSLLGVPVAFGFQHDATPSCPADVDGDGAIGFNDLVSVLSSWGPCAGCPQDIDGDGQVAFNDLIAVLSSWGPC